MRVSDIFLLFCNCTLNFISKSNDFVLGTVVIKDCGNQNCIDFSNFFIDKSNLLSLSVTDIHCLGSGIVNVYVAL